LQLSLDLQTADLLTLLLYFLESLVQLHLQIVGLDLTLLKVQTRLMLILLEVVLKLLIT
jgi:hypothetical protein